jgi:carboxylesterase type B
LEWLRDNIGAFGGDCDRIIVFGQSAGSVSVGYLAYSYPDDPIVAGYIMHSGTPHSWTPETPDVAAAHWYNASSFLGCGSTGDVLECMKAQNTSAILAAVAKNPFDPSPALLQPQFQPKVDNVTVFPNYTQLAATGKLAKLVSSYLQLS